MFRIIVIVSPCRFASPNFSPGKGKSSHARDDVEEMEFGIVARSSGARLKCRSHKYFCRCDIFRLANCCLFFFALSFVAIGSKSACLFFCSRCQAADANNTIGHRLGVVGCVGLATRNAVFFLGQLPCCTALLEMSYHK